MLARDIMTTDVWFVYGHASIGDAAQLLVEKNVSAVPVVDDDLRPIGMVSEGDLIRTDEIRREERCQQWLARLAEGHPLHPGFVEAAQRRGELVRDIMSSPAITVSETAEIFEVAKLMDENWIKRVIVIKAERMVGLVSRWDIVRAVATERKALRSPAPSFKDARARPGPVAQKPSHNRLAAPETKILPLGADVAGPPIPAWLMRARSNQEPPPPEQFLAANFRALVRNHEIEEDRQRAENRRKTAEIREKRIKELAARRLTDADWREMLQRARKSAGEGMKEYMLIRFPSQLCSDGGRAINAPDPSWPSFLRGEPADVFDRWAKELKPHGFGLAAQVIEFPDGVPGDAALFLIWGGG
jgi:CBS domain-containing protein